MQQILIKRIYEPVQKSDGIRVLVDRLWPRGIKKATAAIDDWAKELAPSASLRTWFNHDVSKWGEFKKKYLQELKSNPTMPGFKNVHKSDKIMTLLYAAKDENHNNAVVLQQYLSGL